MARRYETQRTIRCGAIRLWALALSSVCLSQAQASAPIRIACIGNSITDNSHSQAAYPVRFNQLLGTGYTVLNAGYSGSSLIRSGPMPYYKGRWFQEVFKFLPDIITIKLGTNDSQPGIWDAHKGEYAADLRWMVDTLRSMRSKPLIYLCTPIPAWRDQAGIERYGIRGAVIKDEIVPKIRQVAAEKGLTVFDLHTPFLPYRSLTIDGVHPDAVGLDTLAHILYRAFKAATPVSNRSRIPIWEPGWKMRQQVHAVANPLAPLGTDAAGRRLK